jgi:hypothetical protein
VPGPLLASFGSPFFFPILVSVDLFHRSFFVDQAVTLSAGSLLSLPFREWIFLEGSLRVKDLAGKSRQIFGFKGVAGKVFENQ